VIEHALFELRIVNGLVVHVVKLAILVDRRHVAVHRLMQQIAAVNHQHVSFVACSATLSYIP